MCEQRKGNREYTTGAGNITNTERAGVRLDTLVRDAFVKRTADLTDRRMMRVALTPKGGKFIERLLPGHFKRMAALMAPLSQSERKMLVKLLNKVLQKAFTLNTDSISS